MNIIRSMHNIPYTMVSYNMGERKVYTDKGVSLLVLSRGNRFQRAEIFSQYIEYNFNEIISLEVGRPSYDVESLASKYHQLRFIIIPDDNQLSIGALINLAMNEARYSYVFVLWNDMILPNFNARLFEKLYDTDVLCNVPVIRNSKTDIIQNCIQPHVSFTHDNDKSAHFITVEYILPSRNNMNTLYPFDYVGIYHRDHFLRIGGYATDIINPYWQKLDFGMRAHMQGEEIKIFSYIKVETYGIEYSMDDMSIIDDDSYLFYLRTFAVSVSETNIYVPFHAFWHYVQQKYSQQSFVHMFLKFIQMRKWVKECGGNLVKDAYSVIDQWE